MPSRGTSSSCIQTLTSGITRNFVHAIVAYPSVVGACLRSKNASLAVTQRVPPWAQKRDLWSENPKPMYRMALGGEGGMF